MRLYVIDDYRCRGVHHPKGAVLEVSREDAAFLMVDAPGCFALEPPSPAMVDTVSIETPPADRMMRRSKTK